MNRHQHPSDSGKAGSNTLVPHKTSSKSPSRSPSSIRSHHSDNSVASPPSKAEKHSLSSSMRIGIKSAKSVKSLRRVYFRKSAKKVYKYSQDFKPSSPSSVKQLSPIDLNIGGISLRQLAILCLIVSILIGALAFYLHYLQIQTYARTISSLCVLSIIYILIAIICLFVKHWASLDQDLFLSL